MNIPISENTGTGYKKFQQGTIIYIIKDLFTL